MNGEEHETSRYVTHVRKDLGFCYCSMSFKHVYCQAVSFEHAFKGERENIKIDSKLYNSNGY